MESNRSRNATRAFRVLTLDGGGMRGLYTAALLNALSHLFDKRFANRDPDIGKSFDLICGIKKTRTLRLRVKWYS